MSCKDSENEKEKEKEEEEGEEENLISKSQRVKIKRVKQPIPKININEMRLRHVNFINSSRRKMEKVTSLHEINSEKDTIRKFLISHKREILNKYVIIILLIEKIIGSQIITM